MTWLQDWQQVVLNTHGRMQIPWKQIRYITNTYEKREYRKHIICVHGQHLPLANCGGCIPTFGGRG
jgi:hypothetical protein